MAAVGARRPEPVRHLEAGGMKNWLKSKFIIPRWQLIVFMLEGAAVGGLIVYLVMGLIQN